MWARNVNRRCVAAFCFLVMGIRWSQAVACCRGFRFRGVMQPFFHVRAAPRHIPSRIHFPLSGTCSRLVRRDANYSLRLSGDDGPSQSDLRAAARSLCVEVPPQTDPPSSGSPRRLTEGPTLTRSLSPCCSWFDLVRCSVPKRSMVRSVPGRRQSHTALGASPCATRSLPAGASPPCGRSSLPGGA